MNKMTKSANSSLAGRHLTKQLAGPEATWIVLLYRQILGAYDGTYKRPGKSSKASCVARHVNEDSIAIAASGGRRNTGGLI